MSRNARFNVVAQHTAWTMGGIASFLSTLVRGLQRKGIPAHVLVTEERQNTKRIELPTDFEVKLAPWKDKRSIATRWKALIQYLEERAPCVYLTNYDYMYSCVTPQLSNRVVVVDNMHSDVDLVFEYFGRLGPYSNMTVAGSEHIRQKAKVRFPHLADRLCVIPYGVPMPDRPPTRVKTQEAPLRILYTGRLDQLEKRILDLPRIVDALIARGVPVQLSVTGRGGDENALKAAGSHLVDRGLMKLHGFVSDQELVALYEQSDVIILTSAIEGKPLSLLEGMGRGCIPVATDIPSGVPELVTDRVNGYLVPVGAIDTFADRLETIYRDLSERERLSKSAFESVSGGGYRVEDMVASYIKLFEQLLHDAESGAFRRAAGEIRMAPEHQKWLGPSWKDWLPTPVRTAAKHFRAALRHGSSAAARREGRQVPD
jgi:glycosyltransferase involved in cell wall biosynthesis